MIYLARLRAANTKRVLRWHPGGVNDWSLTDWANAMGGEAGEACNAIKKLRRVEDNIANRADDVEDNIANRADDDARLLATRSAAIVAIGDELADVIIYADLLALRAGLGWPQSYGHDGGVHGLPPIADFGAALLFRTGRVCETAIVMAALAELRPEGVNPLLNTLAVAINDAVTTCDHIAAMLEVDLSAAIVAKFNATSERYDFPERIDRLSDPPEKARPASAGAA